jgi:hypothetical protein
MRHHLIAATQALIEADGSLYRYRHHSRYRYRGLALYTRLR